VALPSPLDVLRSVLGASERAESDVAHAVPLRETHELEAKLAEAVAAVTRACESLERHAEVLGTLSDALPALTDSVTHLTDELARLLTVTAPLAAAEREASRFQHLLRRRRPAEEHADDLRSQEHELG
jgi:chromosome segregation ATPase